MAHKREVTGKHGALHLHCRKPPLGQIALDLGHVTTAALEECLLEQQNLSRIGQPMMLGQILLRKGYLQTDHFLQILRIQRSRVVRCATAERNTPGEAAMPSGVK
mgnify:CR=1 FL=1